MTTAHVATISRTELGLSALDLFVDPYNIVTINPGAVPYRRETVTSPYVAGRTEIGAVKDDVEASIIIRVDSTTAAGLQSALSALVSAFSQTSYTLTYSLDGTSYAWTCKPASYGLADGFDLPTRWHHLARVAFTFPRSPIAASGPL